MELEEKKERPLVAQPLKNTTLTEVKMLEASNLNPGQAEQINMFKDTVTTLKELLEDSGSFRK